ncbi:hypothetical protein MIPYR_10001 [uncultured Microbacterium sp.]|uniref:Uncharacterized protein n=1 Tax=uncultured Microbacterium sp. TaxID=191216 RepID=A0A1Y5NWZ8_9MICO|nr:hypothetical protein MIPYR_10001 [uncultured Microbacterium sp.]
MNRGRSLDPRQIMGRRARNPHFATGEALRAPTDRSPADEGTQAPHPEPGPGTSREASSTGRRQRGGVGASA